MRWNWPVFLIGPNFASINVLDVRIGIGLRDSKMHEWIDTILEAYIALVLTVEYLWGRSDTDIKKEETRKRKKRFEFEHLNQGEHK